MKEKLSKEDFLRWKENNFTQFFFSCLKQEADELREIIIQSIKQAHDPLINATRAGRLDALDRLINSDFDNDFSFFIEEEEEEDEES